MNKNENVTEVKDQENATGTKSQENFATELFCAFKKQQTGRTIISAISIIGLVIVILAGMCAYLKSEKEWKDLFSSYDYVSQDGGGINNINTGTQGGLDNGSDLE